MSRVVRHVLSLVLAIVALSFVGCESSGVGDPCVPEQIPDNGFDSQETYLETSSVQCRTRVCMVRNFVGKDPTAIDFGPDDPRSTCTLGVDEVCNEPEDVDNAVYCTCRCRAPEGSNTPTCSCPDGFVCQDVLETGGVGIQGGYCVRAGT